MHVQTCISLVIPTRERIKGIAKCFKDNNQKIKIISTGKRVIFFPQYAPINHLFIFSGIVIYILVNLGSLFKPFPISLIPNLRGFDVLFNQERQKTRLMNNIGFVAAKIFLKDLESGRDRA